MTKIEEHRRFLRERMESGRRIDAECHTEISPDGCIELRIDAYSGGPGRDFAEHRLVRIRAYATGRDLAELLLEDDHFFHSFISSGDNRYLVCAEVLEGGQTVVDLSSGVVASVVCEHDSYIWCEFFLSPDGTKLAIYGCYWACPYMITVYDFRAPMTLPLPRLSQFLLPRSNARFLRWHDSSSFSVRVDKTNLEQRFSLETPPADNA